MDATARDVVPITTAQAAIAFSGVGLVLGGQRIYDDITLAIAPQALACIVGPSGCGKSTALRLIGGLLPVQSGRVTVCGASPAQAWQRLAYVFQAPRLLPWKDALDNAAFGLELRRPGLTRRQRRDRAAMELERVGLGADLHKRPAMLSGGERQRVAIARAFALDPEIILMDEPFSALDPRTRRRLRQQLAELWRDTGKTIVFVTHDIDEALELATEVIAFSPKPATVQQVLRVGGAHPRDPADPALRLARDVLLGVFDDSTSNLEPSPA